MAERPAFISIEKPPYVIQKTAEFKYFSGFSVSQKQKNISALHQAISTPGFADFSDTKILEVSTKSMQDLGTKLSAFNLTTINEARDFAPYTIEVLFQSSKVFEHGGPYTDILDKSPTEAKRDERLKNSGKIIQFEYQGEVFSNTPTSYFYNWLYISALNSHPEYHSELCGYNIFTDIEFNPKKSINCQARAVAIFVSLMKASLLEEAMKNKENFLKVVYGESSGNVFKEAEQLSLL